MGLEKDCGVCAVAEISSEEDRELKTVYRFLQIAKTHFGSLKLDFR